MRRPWIKIEICTPDKPEICSLATQLKMDDDAVVGKLVRLWSWAELNRINPNDLGVTKEFIDKLVGRKGFALALEKTGWLIETDEKLSFRNFKRHNSPVAQNKALTAKRVARHRLRKADGAEKVQDKPLAVKAVKAPKLEKRNPVIEPAEEVIIVNSPLVISEEHAGFIEPEIAHNITPPAKPAAEPPIVEEEPEMQPEEAIEEVVVTAYEEVIEDALEVPAEELVVAAPEVVITAAPEAPAEEVAVVAPVEEPAPRKRRGKAAQQTEDQPMLF